MWMVVGAWLGCAPKTPADTAPAPEAPAPDPAAGEREEAERRAFAPIVNGKPVLHGISYGPFREGQRPGGPNPTDDQILEDLKIVSQRWHMIRVYSSADPTEAILRTIRDHELPLVVMVGAWIGPEDPAKNAEEAAGAIRLANAYPNVVCAVNVGNETQVDWSGHRTDQAELLRHLQAVRTGVRQPVTTADDYNFWNKPHSQEVADKVDFLLLHAYAMWNGKSLDEAVSWTAETHAAIQGYHPELPIVFGETGWATELNPEGHEVQYIKAPAGESEQMRFYEEFRAWAEQASVPYFYFEAFDEPWKGSDDPREVEKHWGLFNVDRTPKKVFQSTD